MDTIIIRTAPVSVNVLYRGRRFLTKEGKAIKESVAWEIKSQWKNKKVMESDVKIYIDFYFKNKRMDIDNAIKSLLDCMTGIVWKDDSQIVELLARKYIDKKKPKIIINVYEIK